MRPAFFFRCPAFTALTNQSCASFKDQTLKARQRQAGGTQAPLREQRSKMKRYPRGGPKGGEGRMATVKHA